MRLFGCRCRFGDSSSAGDPAAPLAFVPPTRTPETSTPRAPAAEEAEPHPGRPTGAGLPPTLVSKDPSALSVGTNVRKQVGSFLLEPRAPRRAPGLDLCPRPAFSAVRPARPPDFRSGLGLRRFTRSRPRPTRQARVPRPLLPVSPAPLAPPPPPAHPVDSELRACGL